MIHILKTIKVNTAVSSLQIIDNEIHILDDSFLINVYSNENYSIINKHLLLKEQNDRHAYDKSYSISGSKNSYISKYSDNNGLLYSVKNNKIIKFDKLNYHENAVTVSKFSHNSKLLAIGDEDGKVFFYDLYIKNLIFSFDPRADAISSITFSRNDRYVTIASYDKTLSIYNIESHQEMTHFSLSDVVEDSIYLCNGYGIAGITRDKRLFTYSSDVNKIFYGKFEFDEWPSVIIHIGYNHFLVGTRGDTLYLVKEDTLEIIRKIKTKQLGVKTLTFNNNKLYIGYIDGHIEILDTIFLLDEFKNNIKTNKFAKATSLIEKNVFLLINEVIQKYDKVWDQVLDIAKGHLINKDEERALRTVKPFFFDKRKEEEYNFLHSNKKDFTHFMDLVKNEKDVMAFKYADEKVYLKQTKEYALIENKWNKVYQVCKLLFSKDSLESSQKAIDTLKRYVNINSKKSQVENLITNYKHFIRAQKLVKARNFRLYHILAEKKPFLAQEDLYKKVTQLGHQAYLKLLEQEAKEDFDKATQTAKYLLDFTTLKEKANERMKIIQSKINLQEYINSDDIYGVYETIEQNKELENFRSFVEYHKIYDDTKEEALSSAKDGNTEIVHNTFDKYYDISYLEKPISLVFKLSYICEMKNAMNVNPASIHWLETIKRYTNLYGWDNEIISFQKEFGLEEKIMQSKIDFDKKSKNKIEFYDSILVHT